MSIMSQRIDTLMSEYEEFLAQHDPKQRQQRGVYATPQPVVSYMVRSLDILLKNNLGVSRGLANNDVIVLDPATGTGTFLSTIIQHLHTSHTGGKRAWTNRVKSLYNRMVGYEVLSLPCTIAQNSVKQVLEQTGVVPNGNDPLHIYHTNALCESHLPFADESQSSESQSSESQSLSPTIVVIGNPPYAGHSATNVSNNDKQTPEKPCVKPIMTKVHDDYYMVNGKKIDEKNPKWLQDDYVKFVALGQWWLRRIGRGVVAFITNNSYLDNPTFRGMRESLLQEYDTIYILNLHGNTRRREHTPDGLVDKNVFDIQQGVAITFFIKQQAYSKTNATIWYADLWGSRAEKDSYLEEQTISTTEWQTVTPTSPWYLFVPHNQRVWKTYTEGWKITDAMPIQTVGIVTGGDSNALAFTEQEAVKLACSQGMDATDAEKIIQYVAYRPFDTRFLLYDKRFVTRPREQVMRHMLHENLALSFQRGHSMAGSVNPPQITNCMIDQGLSYPANRALSRLAPLYIFPEHSMAYDKSAGSPNFDPKFISEIEQEVKCSFVQYGRGDGYSTFGPEDVLYYIYSTLHSNSYRNKYADFLKIDVPFIPLPSNRDTFFELADKGATLAHIFLLRHPAPHYVNYTTMKNAVIDKISYQPPTHIQGGRVVLGPNHYFSGIEPAVWHSRVGNYQPLVKWLKDRRGRVLKVSDVEHYRKIVGALRDMQAILAQINSIV